MEDFKSMWQEVEAMPGKLIDIEKARLFIAKLTPPKARRFAAWLCHYKEPVDMSKPIEKMNFSELIRIPYEQQPENFHDFFGKAVIVSACEAAGREDFGLLIIKELTSRKRLEILCKKNRYRLPRLSYRPEDVLSDLLQK